MTVRGIYISLGYPNHAEIDRLYFLGQTPDFFVLPGMLILASLITMAIGYRFGPTPTRNTFSKFVQFDLSIRKIYYFSIIALLISIGCIILYARLTGGGFDLLNLSKKRTLIDAVEVSSKHRTWQSLRTIASISLLAHLLVLADALRVGSSYRFWKLSYAGILFLGRSVSTVLCEFPRTSISLWNSFPRRVLLRLQATTLGKNRDLSFFGRVLFSIDVGTSNLAGFFADTGRR